jgi:broad specificity phosphatase PhoE
MKRTTQTIVSASIASWLIAAIIGFSPSNAPADSPQSKSPNTTIIYFLRHAEDVPEMEDSDPTFSITFNDCNADESCCVEALNPLGKVRAAALAVWFKENKIADTLTCVIASHKLRTRQTVEGIANAAGLGGDLNGDGIPDGTDVDQEPGDGVIDVPGWPAECDEGWEKASAVTQPQIDFISDLPVGSRAVVCSHSGTLYPIMEAFGIDTSNDSVFPKDAKGKVLGFNNLWIVELKPFWNGSSFVFQGQLLQHLYLDLKLGASLIDRHHGCWSSHTAKDDED